MKAIFGCVPERVFPDMMAGDLLILPRKRDCQTVIYLVFCKINPEACGSVPVLG